MNKELSAMLNENRHDMDLWRFAMNEAGRPDYYNPYTSNGNTKLKSNDKISFIIWNLPAVMTCPFRTPLCESNCYAIKAEKQYGLNCQLRRFANFELSRRPDFVRLMINHLTAKVNHWTRRNKTIVIRIHESGDFYSKEYALKWLDIARYFEHDKRIVFMAYTKSLPYFEGVDVPNNFVIRASIWEDTEKYLLDMSAKYPQYTAMTPDEMKVSRAAFCDCVDCGKCGMCWSKLIMRIACLIH